MTTIDCTAQSPSVSRTKMEQMKNNLITAAITLAIVALWGHPVLFSLAIYVLIGAFIVYRIESVSLKKGCEPTEIEFLLGCAVLWPAAILIIIVSCYNDEYGVRKDMDDSFGFLWYNKHYQLRLPVTFNQYKDATQEERRNV